MKGKAIKTLCAIALTTGLFTVLPTGAEAFSLGSILGDAGKVLDTVHQYKALEDEAHYKNETEEGRQEVFENMKETYGVAYNDYYNGQLDDIMSRLSQGIAEVDPTINDMPYLYFMCPDPNFNAFCSYGHVMCVNIGMFYLTTNPDEVAVVLGHEMGHGQEKHVANALLKRAKTDYGAAIISGSLSGTALSDTVMDLAVNQVKTVQIGRKDEWEADNLSFDYIYHAGYNPGATAAIWQRVIEKMGDNSASFVGEIFSPSDHPSNAQRRDNYEKKLAELSGKHITIKKDSDTVQVNKKDFVTPAPAADMSSAERKYFVMGNLVSAYAHGQAGKPAEVVNGTVMLGNQAIMTPAEGDPTAEELAALLNKIK